jgi:putative ABC transport system permease protein
MSLARLILSRIRGSPFRSALVFLCVALVSGSMVWGTLVLWAAHESLRLSVAGMENPGVDLVVVPRIDGYSLTGLDNVNLEKLLGDVRAVPGVWRASPQLLLSTITGSGYSAEPEIYLVAFDPATDFSLLRWLPGTGPQQLGLNEAVAGSLVSALDESGRLELGGYSVLPVGSLAPTGTSIDRSVYVSFETYREAGGLPGGPQGEGHATVEKSAPYILVGVQPGSDPAQVGGAILKNVRGVSVFDNAVFFGELRQQMTGLGRSIPAILAAGWVLAALSSGLVFFIAVNERRRETGILRALGSTRSFVLRSLLLEGAVLALAGSLLGISASFLGARNEGEIIANTGVRLGSFPGFSLFTLGLESLGLAILSVLLGVLIPVWGTGRQEPGVGMRA